MFICFYLIRFLLIIRFIEIRLFLIVLSKSPLSYLSDLCIKVNDIFLFGNVFIIVFYILSSRCSSSNLLKRFFTQCNFRLLGFLRTCLFLLWICSSNTAWLLFFHITDFFNNWHWRFILIIRLYFRYFPHHWKSQIIILITLIFLLLSVFISFGFEWKINRIFRKSLNSTLLRQVLWLENKYQSLQKYCPLCL